MNKKGKGLGIILGLFFNLLGLLGVLIYPSQSEERSNFVKGWSIGFIISLVLSVVVGILVGKLFMDMTNDMMDTFANMFIK